MEPRKPFRHHVPLKVAEETYLIRQLQGEGEGPVSVYINSLVIRGKEPIIVDTGTKGNREDWIKDVFSLVDPKDVRWIYLSHDDPDHTGNIEQALEMCPRATLVTNWFSVERLASEIGLPLERMRWVNDGESFDAGDRTFGAVRPPFFDSPTTRGLYDSKTGVYWASDSFAAPVTEPTDYVEDLNPVMWREGFMQLQSLLSPWHAMLDEKKFGLSVDRVASLRPTVIAGAHSPLITGRNVSEVLDLSRLMPNAPVAEMPGQAVLEAIVAEMTAVPLAA